jgi:hypothetical protein
MKQLKSVEFWCFLLLLINMVTVGVDFYFRRSAAALVPFPPGQMIFGTGITGGGNPPAAGAPYHLVRYASIYCGFCAPKYSQAWNELEKTLTSKGGDAIIVSPFAGDLPPGDGATPEQKLAGVSLQFVQSTHFNSTPITLLVDREWRVLWSHVGVLDSGDAREALKTIGDR